MKPAMEFFKLAGRYNHAIRLGFEKNMDYDVVNYALESPNKRHTMLAARKFEAKNSLEHAVRLYQNCGEIKRALELCFKAVPPMFDRYDRNSASARSVTVLAISLVLFVRASVLMSICLFQDEGSGKVAERQDGPGDAESML